MKRLTLFSWIAVLMILTVGGCKKDEETSICGRLTFSSRAELDISMTCTSRVRNRTGTQPDQYGRPISYEFDYHCSDGSETYTGRVYDITWNEIGQVLSARATINGREYILTAVYSGGQYQSVNCTAA